MIITRIKLKNWRNFRNVDVKLGDRVFLVGPNASGKSNFLDAFRFLRDLTKTGGGLQKALRDRGGISKIRNLSARQDPEIGIEIELSEKPFDSIPSWNYSITIRQDPRGKRYQKLSSEIVINNGKTIVERPMEEDKQDVLRTTETFLEQINENAKFREIVRHLKSISYIHLIPQILQHPNVFTPIAETAEDPFGRNLIKQIGETRKDIRESRLKKIGKALNITVPQFTNLQHMIDEQGIHHLEATYEHWRPNAGRQREDQFSDGTLRLIALLWALLDNKSLLLFEEPELSLHVGIVRKLPGLMHRILSQNRDQQQVIISTHSADLLFDKSIAPEELLLFRPSKYGSEIESVSDNEVIRRELEAGIRAGDAIISRTEPKNLTQLSLF